MLHHGVAVIGDALGEGAEGTVYALEPPHDATVLKVFDVPEDHAERVAVLRLLLRRQGCTWANSRISAPEEMVAEDGEFAAVTAARVVPPSVPFEDYVAWLSARDKELDLRIRAAGNLAEALSEIHASGFVVGDLTPTNLFVSKHDHWPAFVDVDSWGFTPPPVPDNQRGLVDPLPMIPAALCKGPYVPAGTGAGPMSVDTDRFALAVLIAELLLGHHPYGSDPIGTPRADTDERVALRECWLLAPARFALPEVTFPGGHPGIAALGEAVGSIMRDALTRESGRPAAHDWMTALRTVDLDPCPSCARAVPDGGVCVPCYRRPAPTSSTPRPTAAPRPSARHRSRAATAPPPRPSAPGREARGRAGTRRAWAALVVLLVFVAYVLVRWWA